MHNLQLFSTKRLVVIALTSLLVGWLLSSAAMAFTFAFAVATIRLATLAYQQAHQKTLLTYVLRMQKSVLLLNRFGITQGVLPLMQPKLNSCHTKLDEIITKLDLNQTLTDRELRDLDKEINDTFEIVEHLQSAQDILWQVRLTPSHDQKLH